MAVEVKAAGEGNSNKPHGSAEGCTTSKMGVEGKKELLRQIPRVKLWLVLALTGTFTVVLLAAAHITHSLTLRVEAYHALYNLLSLIGCLLTMKLCSRPESLHNTFGWARLEVLSMLTTLLFLLALCFSVVIESVQTAVHAEHQDAMHHPLSVMTLGGVGLCLNALVFVLIGGYTHHQGCFLEMRDSGSVWVGRQVTQEAVQAGRRMLSSNDLRAGGVTRPPRAIQLLREVLRDALGLVMVIMCAAVVYWDNGGTVALYIDPALAVTSSALLVWCSYPYGKECGQILLQTIPGHIDVEAFQTRVLEQFPAILNIHHLHIWSFTPTKVVATAHMVFSNPRVYLATQPALRQFFMDEGITKVTIQPECLTAQFGSPKDLPVCLLRCQHEGCHARDCCSSSHFALLTSVTSTHPTTRRRGSKESGKDSEEDTERQRPGVSGRQLAEEVNGVKAATREESKTCHKTENVSKMSDEKSSLQSLSESSRTETEILESNLDTDGETSCCIPDHRELRDEKEWTCALDKVTVDSGITPTQRGGGGDETLTPDSVPHQHYQNTTTNTSVRYTSTPNTNTINTTNTTTTYATPQATASTTTTTTSYTTKNTDHCDIGNTTQYQYTSHQDQSNTSEGDHTNQQRGSMRNTSQQQQEQQLIKQEEKNTSQQDLSNTSDSSNNQQLKSQQQQQQQDKENTTQTHNTSYQGFGDTSKDNELSSSTTTQQQQQQQQQHNTSASYNTVSEGDETNLQTTDNTSTELEAAVNESVTQPPRRPHYSDEAVNEATELLHNFEGKP